jgi:UDP-glucose 4-epimerase
MNIARTDARVLVTGGAGFIGSHLVDYLVSKGCRVTVLDNFRKGTHGNLAESGRSGRLEIIEGDITDAQTCFDAVATGTDAVFHLACLGVRHSLHNPFENHEVNAMGTLQMLLAARKVGVGRFIYMSTSEVYGAASTFPLTENAATWPTTVYGASKLAGEHYSAAFATCYGMPVTRVRCFNNYGPRAHFEGDSGEAVPRFILRALAGEPPIIFGDGSNTRDFLYVKDCAEALVSIAECDALVGEIVNLGYGEEVRIDMLARLVLEATGRTDLIPVLSPDRPGDVPRLWVDSSKLRAATGFRPRTPPQRGLPATVEYFRGVFAAQPDCLDRMQTRNWEVA